MNIEESMVAEALEFRKSNQHEPASVIMSVLGDVRADALMHKTKITDQVLIKAIKTDIKNRRELEGSFRKLKRVADAQNTRDDIKLLEKYLPKEATDEEIIKIINETSAEFGPGDHKAGPFMGAIMKKLKGGADGKRVSKLLAEHLKIKAEQKGTQ